MMNDDDETKYRANDLGTRNGPGDARNTGLLAVPAKCAHRERLAFGRGSGSSLAIKSNEGRRKPDCSSAMDCNFAPHPHRALET
jgi:hypothetical protein